MDDYRKKPVVIQAKKVEGLVDVEALEEFGAIITATSVFDKLHNTWVNYEMGDFIIRGIQGEFYPCKPDVFEATYEPVLEGG